MVLIADFPANYVVTLESATAAPSTPSFGFRANGNLTTAPAIEILVTPVGDGRAWHGAFFGQRDGLSVLAHTPDPDQLLVVAGGVPYWVPVDAPDSYIVLPVRPVRSVHCSLARGLIILAGYSNLLAVDRDGRVVWRSADLASDGFTEVRLASTVVVTRGFFAPEDREVETTIDLGRGAILGRL